MTAFAAPPRRVLSDAVCARPGARPRLDAVSLKGSRRPGHYQAGQAVKLASAWHFYQVLCRLNCHCQYRRAVETAVNLRISGESAVDLRFPSSGIARQRRGFKFRIAPGLGRAVEDPSLA